MNSGKGNMAPRRRRPRGSSRRDIRVVVKFSVGELAEVEQKASRAGFAVSAFLGQLALSGGSPEDGPTGLLAPLNRLSGKVDRLAAALERMADRMNSTSLPSTHLDRVLDYANKILAQVDEVTLGARQGR